MIATRTDPPLRLAQLRARGELCEIRAEDLRFTTEEAIRFLNHSMGLDLTSHDITTLTQKTEGWIAGLQLAAISLQGDQDRQAFVRAFAGDDRYIADYLLDEALSRQPPLIQAFLLQTSILDRLSAPLCAAVTGQNESQSILGELERANLFLAPLDSQRNWYRYHHLFADLLNNHLRRTQPEEVLELHKKASSWYEDNGLIPDAINHALAANDIERIVQLAEGLAVYKMDYGELSAFVAWLDRLPEATFRQHPWLLVTRTWALYNTGEYESVEDNLIEIERILSKESISDELARRIQGHVAAIRSYMAEVRDDAALGIQKAEDALALLPKSDLKLRAFVAIRWANCLVMFGGFDRAIQAYKEAGETSKVIGDGHLAITALSEMAVVQMFAGKLRQAVSSIKEINNYAEMLAKKSGRRLPAMGILYRHISHIKRELNQLPEAEYYAKEAVKICRQWGEKEALLYGLAALNRAQFDQGEFEKVDQNLEEMLQMADQISPLTVRYFQNWMIHFQLMQGRIADAETWVRDLGLTPNDDFDYIGRFEYQNLTHLMAAKGYYSEALKIVNVLVKGAADVGDRIYTIQYQVLQAIILNKLNKFDEAMDAMEKALSLAQTEGYVRSILDEGEPVNALLYQAAQKGIYPQYCKRLLDEAEKLTQVSFGSIEGKTTEAMSHLVEPLSDREIEVLKHIAQGSTNQEIAQQLILSLYTVKSHARNIYSKLGVKNRTEAVARARLLGLLSQD
jgi:LuxR family maltose regulon positive regulatory protein